MAQVAFYRLSRKIVNQSEDIPEDARQVMYYSLAIGHHVGVMDCLSEIMTVPVETYKSCLALLPECDARRKLEGVLTWHEIEVNRGHADTLLPALHTLQEAAGIDVGWLGTLTRCLQEMVAEPALYLMVKMRA
jgi:hydrogenase-4 component J